MPIITANGISIAYDLHYPSSPSSSATDPPPSPKGSTIVLINGLADPKETWSLQLPALLSAGYTVLTYDNRGIGASSSPTGPYSAELLATDLHCLIEHLRTTTSNSQNTTIPPAPDSPFPEKFHLMGISMGGMIAQTYCLSYPTSILSLTLACTYASPGPFCSRMFSMWADMAPILGVPFVMRDVLLWAFTTDFFSDPLRAGELREVETGMAEMTQSTAAYLAQLAVIRDFDTRERLREIDTAKIPTLVLVGEQDILIPVSLSRRLHESIPGSKWKTVRGGHGCVWEFPDSFNEAFLEFIESV